MIEGLKRPLEAPKPKEPTPLTEREQLKNQLQVLLKKINILEQRLDKARIEGKTKLADLFNAEITKSKLEMEGVFHQLQSPDRSPKAAVPPLSEEPVKTEVKRPAVDVPAPRERISIGSQAFPNIPHEQYKEASKQIAQKAAEAEILERAARRNSDLKLAEVYKQKRMELMEQQRKILREAAISKSINREK